VNELEKILCGQTESHLVLDDVSGKLVHKDMLMNLIELRDEGRLQGFEMAITSSFRGFEAQLKIWNAKARGERDILNSNGQKLNFADLSKKQLVHAILRWSALPGASRHHWGSDFDVYDLNAMPEGYKVQLIPEETEGDGLFAPMHDWLDEALSNYDFYRPYSQDNGGIAPERWHLSFAPISNQFEKLLTIDLIESVIKNAEIELKETILEELPEIYTRYIQL
jgi:LAS superfamily LD-carboxypeptidase LdcB